MQNTEAGYAVSILIPAYNEERTILECLLRIAKHMPEDISHEIIVCDNASTDDTQDIVKASKLATIIYRPATVNVASVRNSLARAAHGQTLIFLDADCLVTEEWGANLHHILPATDMVTGSNVVPMTGQSWVEKAYFSPMSQFAGLREYVNTGHLIVGALDFQRIGAFDEGLSTGEDVEFCERARYRGWEVVPYQTLKVYHADFPRTAKQFFFRELWHGGGDWANVGTVCASTPALIGILFLAVTAFSLFMALAGQYNYAFVLYTLIPMMAMVISVTRIPVLPTMKIRLQNVYLIILYAYARGLGFLTRSRTTRILKESTV